MSWTVKEKMTTAGRYFLLFIFVSFLGWLGETIGCSIDIGAYCDRGFVNMPLCPIYGFTVLILYALLGTPEQGGIILGDIQSPYLRVPLYFVLGTLITTALEFFVGWFFADVLGAKLWDYSYYPDHFQGHICLRFSILWGILILLGMKYVFGPVRRVIAGLPVNRLLLISGISALLLLTDWIVSFSRILF